MNVVTQTTPEVVAILRAFRVQLATTQGPQGALHCSPIPLLHVDRDALCWFAVSVSDVVAQDVRVHKTVLLTAQSHHTSLHLNGYANLIDSNDVVDKYWNEALRSDFPDGPRSSLLAMLRVRPTHLTLWDSERRDVLDVDLSTYPKRSCAGSQPALQHEALRRLPSGGLHPKEST